MNTKRILRAFNKDIKVRYYINGQLIKETTVQGFIDDGLNNYSTVDEGAIKIEDNTIIIEEVSA